MMLQFFGAPARLCAFLALSLACGCTGESTPQQQGAIRIAVIPKGTLHDFWGSVHEGAKQAAAELGVTVEWKGPDPEGDREAQVRVVENFVSKGVKGIVLAPVDDRALAPVVAEAAAAGIPTVVIDSALQGTKHVAYVATDNKQGGALAARHLGGLLGGKGTVVVLRFMEGSASTMEREAGFLETLAAEFPGVKVLSDNQYGGDSEKAYKAAESLLTAHPQVDAAFASNESTSMGMLRALQDAKLAGKVRFCGFDSSPRLAEGLVQGAVHGLVLQDPVAIGREGVRAMVAHLRGTPVQRDVRTALVLATPQNLADAQVKSLLFPAGSGAAAK